MRNCWGQKIEIGSVVYRGARQGNSSEFKLGTVESIKNRKPRVKWMFESGTRWIRIDGEMATIPYVYKMRRESFGNPSVEGLVVVDMNLEELERQSQFFSTLDRESEFRSWQEYEDVLESIL